VIRTVLFDLDDTLYPERDFYRSGFAVVADLIEQRGIGPAQRSRELFEHLHFCESREGVFDKASLRLGFPADWIPELVASFQNHVPHLRLPADSAETLRQLRTHYRLGIVTDGHAAVQRRKIDALGLAALVDAILVADDLGREHWKPHPRPFWACCELLGVRPEEAVFVGDHPQRDVRGAHEAGMTAIRLRSPDGYFFQLGATEADSADYEIRQITELGALLAKLSCREALLP
jgi:putative hydrolase of the HAD superfamily